MKHRTWVLLALLAVAGTAACIGWFRPEPYNLYRFGGGVAVAAALLFALNLSYAALFQAIKRSSARSLRVRLAKLARKAMPWHIPIGIVGTALIVVHAGVMLTQFGITVHPKMTTGLASLLLLGLALFAGVLRSRRASGFRRKFHLTTAFLFAASFLVHGYLT
jgi:hypothetical protein